MSWTAPDTDDAWLALDRNGNGTVDGGYELFGNITRQSRSEAANGFVALSEFDKPVNGGNDDGRIDSLDTVFGRLLLWQDTNHDGISQSSELHPPEVLNVTSIDLSYKESKWIDEYGNQFKFRAKIAVVKHSGTGRWAYDVYLISK